MYCKIRIPLGFMAHPFLSYRDNMSDEPVCFKADDDIKEKPLFPNFLLREQSVNV
jgi:hypothetical protein